MLRVIVLSVVMYSVIMPSFVTPSSVILLVVVPIVIMFCRYVIMLSAMVPSVILPNAVMLSVVASAFCSHILGCANLFPRDNVIAHLAIMRGQNCIQPSNLKTFANFSVTLSDISFKYYFMQSSLLSNVLVKVI